MKATHALAVACAAALASAAMAADNPFEAFKGKMKAGMYEYNIQMDGMPGMPAGMKMPPMSFQHCVTEEDIAKGRMNRNPRDQAAQNDCEFKNFKMSGNTASYTMVCKGRSNMTADMVMTFAGDGWKGDMTMNMDREGRQMTMKQHMETRYLGACTK